MTGSRGWRWLVMVLALGVGAACADASEQSAADGDPPGARRTLHE